MAGANNNYYFDRDAGKWFPGEIDGNGSVKFAPQAPATNSGISAFKNLGADATKNISSSSANVLSLGCFNKCIVSRFIQLHNTATIPTDTAVPEEVFLVPPGTQIIIGTDYFTQSGINFSDGVAFAFSTTRDTYTAAPAVDHSTFVKYVT